VSVRYVAAEQEPWIGAAGGGVGVGAVLRIPVPGTNGLAIELTPRGWLPRAGSTSSLFIQEMSGKKHLRLDLGYNKNSQLCEWHWNQKGTFENFGITNHTSVGAPEQLLGKVSKLYRYAGRALLVAGVSADVYSIVVSPRPLRRRVQVVSGWAGAIGACKIVGAVGASVGTTIAPGVGTGSGGLLGCAAGAFLGYRAAERLVGHLYDWSGVELFNQLEHEIILSADAPWQGRAGCFGGSGATGSW